MIDSAKQRHRTSTWKSGESGITLFEILAAVIMLSLGLLTLLPLATLSVTESELDGKPAAALDILQSHMERLRAAHHIEEGSQVDTITGMDTHWWVDTDSIGLQRLNVEVSWRTNLGVPCFQRGSTYLSPPTQPGAE